MKVKIRRPVAAAGKILHKVGGVVEVPDNIAGKLVSDGWVEKVDPKTPLTPGASTEKAASKPVTPAQEEAAAKAAEKAAEKAADAESDK